MLGGRREEGVATPRWGSGLRGVAGALALLGSACAGAPVEAVRDDAPGPPPPPAVVGDYVRLDEDARGYSRPYPDDRECLPYALKRQKALVGVENSVKFAVMRDGSLRDFIYLKPEPPEVAAAIEAAFRSCRWEPALDPKGRPVAVWLIQPIKVR